MKKASLSLIIPCYNEERTLKTCVENCLLLAKHVEKLELIIVDDCSTDQSYTKACELSALYPCVTVLRHDANMGKGAALRTGFSHASCDFVGIQDADIEYTPMDYLVLLEPLLEGKADVVYGSRYLRPDTRRVLSFWHTWMNRTLTFVSNMFTDLDLSDMETCYKLFRRDRLLRLAPLLQENGFGFEPEITALVVQNNFRVYECAIHYNPRTYEEGKKIGWRDGVRALYCILHYGAPKAPLPVQILCYFFIGAVCALANIACFTALISQDVPIFGATLIAFIVAAALNYFLCFAILFRHKARWKAFGEILAYLGTLAVIGSLDCFLTWGLTALGCGAVWSKAWAAVIGFAGNFWFRKYFVF